MLTYINIKNFAIIKDLEVDLQSEMTSLTGETGAGKSIIVDSLELALGARAGSSPIRNNLEKCEITAVFDLTHLHEAKEWLIQQELDSENECIIRRTITNDGRTKSTINGYPCTQQNLRVLSEFLLSIHGQHEHQTLLHLEHQRELLDAFAGNDQIVATVKELYNNWLKIKKELIELESLTNAAPTQIDFLNYQIQELEALDLKPESLEELRTKQRYFSNQEQFSTNLNTALNLLAENDHSTIIKNLYQIKNHLEICQNIDNKINPIIELVNNAIIQTEEAAVALRQNLNAAELDDEQQQNIEEQLTNIHNLARKHQTKPEDLLKTKEALKQELENIVSATTKISELKEAVNNAATSYLEAANELSIKRQLAAKKLYQLVSAKMQIMGMSGGKFVVNLTPHANQSFSVNGLEYVEFLVSANPGHPLQPLNKIASGGELSRISLAIQVITAEKKVTPTLIFDEIDAGIGGKTADIVGKLLRKLSENTQVICITHLPQIAAQSHHQILIEKITTPKSTEVTLTTLSRKERIKEIARMLGGVKITNQTLAHADELLNSAL